MPTKTPSGYEQFRESTASNSDLSRLSQLADQLNAAELSVAKLDEQLNAARARVQDLAERQIPELMDQLGMESFKTRNGFKIDVKRTVRASVPEARREEAWKWLDKNGHSGIIKRTVLVAFTREQEKEAKALQRELGKEFENVKTDLKVEPSTLRAFIAEQLAAGASIPMDLFGAWVQRIAKISQTSS